MTIVKNAETGIREMLLDGILIDIPNPTLENVNGTKYSLPKVRVTYPDGSEETVNGAMYENSINTGLFAVGEKVQLRVQIEGDYAGNAVVQLPSATKVDLAKFDFTGVETATEEVEVNA